MIDNGLEFFTKWQKIIYAIQGGIYIFYINDTRGGGEYRQVEMTVFSLQLTVKFSIVVIAFVIKMRYASGRRIYGFPVW